MSTEALTFKIKTKDLTNLTKLIEELDGKVKLKDVSFRTTLGEAFGKVISEDVRKRFQSSPKTTEGGKVHGDIHWRALSDSYLRSRPERVTGRVLIDSGTLMNSFQTDSPMFISKFNNQFSWEFGTKVGYAAELNKTWPIIKLTDEVMEDLAAAYMKWLVKGFEEKFKE